MRATQQTINTFTNEQLNTLFEGKNVTIKLDDVEITLTPEDVEVTREVREGMVAINSTHMTLMLDTTLNEQLIKEGLAREIINKVNTMRRDAKLEVTDRIYIKMETSPKL